MTINVAYSCNENYIHHTGISILSLLEKNKLIQNINIFFIYKDVSESSIDLLKKLVQQYGRTMNVISFYDICFDLNIKSTGRHIDTIYSKLFFGRIEGIDKILYLDSDTIINDSLNEFWNIDLNDNLIAGVETHSSSLKKSLNLGKYDPCINDGVVLINVLEFRKQNILKDFINCIEEYDGNPPLLSEGVINKVCKGKIKIIHPKYNLMSGLLNYKRDRFANMGPYYDKSIIKDAIISPVIIHYLSAFYNRPWDINCTHPMKDYYLYYKSKSIWKNVPLENKKLNYRLRFIKFIYSIFPNDILDFIRFIKGNKSY